jgi:NADH dehydrogenase [ubiquinone] 1 alpha subcomplex assembly factor 6
LLLPAAARPAYFALRAWNVELASIKDSHHHRRQHAGGVNNNPTNSSGSGSGSGIPPTLALQLRMQWWRQAIAAIYDDAESTAQPSSSTSDTVLLNLATSHWHSPVVRALDRAHQDVQWTRRFLERMLDAREMDLELRQYGTLDESLAYAEDTVSSVLYLTLEIAKVRDDRADETASLAGRGIGLVTLLRALPYRLAQDEYTLPASLLRPDFPYHQVLPTYLNGLDDNEVGEVLTESDALALVDAIRHVALVASEHLTQARRQQGQVPSRGKGCLLPVVPALSYLSKLEQAQYNVFGVTAAPTDRLMLLLRLTRTWATGVF